MDEYVTRREFEVLAERLERQLRQNSTLNKKLTAIIESKKHYLKRRLPAREEATRRKWVKMIQEAHYLKRRMSRDFVFPRQPRTGERKHFLWVTQAQKEKLMNFLATDFRKLTWVSKKATCNGRSNG